MKRTLIPMLICGAMVSLPVRAAVKADTLAVQGVIMHYLPAHYAFAKPKVTDITVNDKKKTLTVKLSESGAYMTLTPDRLAQLKKDIAAALPKEISHYKIVVEADGTDFDRLALFADKKMVRPSEKHRFVTPLSGITSPKGLDGSNIAMWQSHGLYYQGQDRWGWQRPRLWQTCEDLYTQSYVMPFLMPMLQNAGAYVMSPRERDVNTIEYIIDNDNQAAKYSETQGKNSWQATSKPGFGFVGDKLYDRENPFAMGTARYAKAVKDASEASTATWNVDIATPGEYAVYVSYQTLPKSATDAVYTVNAANGAHKFKINQQMGGGTWIYLGHFPLKAGVSELPIVELTNVSSDKNAVITADAVKIGGGMGNVARRPTKPNDDGIEYDYMTSGYPRFTEGARYWLQWAGAPDSVYSATEYTIEYNDDYRSRGYWVNWLAGGSSSLPAEKGLNIPVDLSFAFHTDAGITPGDSIIGTLGIYCTDDKESYDNGTARLAARDLTDLVMTNIVDDVRATYEPEWTRRGMWNRSYAEARVPQVPTMLLELLSHQNFADMRYGLDPGFRFVVSRAVYKAMLKFIAHRDGRDYVVQPLPVHAFTITGGENGEYTLSWAEQIDRQEPTATPTYYIVEHRGADGLGFTPIARVTEPNYSLKVTDHDIHSYRIVAGNDGGVSFPSEVLALCYRPEAHQVLIVNGFTRVSGPEWFDYGDVKGFADFTDAGVPYLQDISFVGSQFEFRKNVPWMANEVAGLGASRADYEDKVLGGNTFDFVAVHGRAIADAGYGFISSSVEAFVNSDVNCPKVLDLIMGNQKEIQVGTGRYGTRFKTFDSALQRRLEVYTQAGGNVFVSGSYIATDLWCNPFSSTETADADKRFAKEVLGYVWRASDASDGDTIVPVKSRYKMFDVLNDITFRHDLNPEMYAVMSPGAVAPADGKSGAEILKYAAGNMPAGAAYVAPTHRAVSIGVPFESITSGADQIMRAVLQFLFNR